MDSIKVAKEFAHALANKLLPLHGRINLLKMQPEDISKEQLSNLERITESMISLNSDFRNKLEDESKRQSVEKRTSPVTVDDKLIELTYSSESVIDKQQVNKTLLDIAENAHQRNTDKGISGFLLYRNGYFVQRIEGPACAIDALFGRICLDHRHKNICLLSRFPISARHFESWEMLKVKNLDENNEVAQFIDRFRFKGWDKITESQSMALAKVVVDL